MNNVRRSAIVFCQVFVAAAAVAVSAAEEPAALVEPLAATARRAGLRVLESERLVLATDRPPREGDGVDQLPRIFDAAFATWCDHYGIPPHTLPTWRAFGCLVVDRERFRSAGLLPDEIPDFVNGFCDRNRFWMQDQSNPAYRRHLLLHEGVHAFTLTVRMLATPAWYNEGIAEYLATHRLTGAGDEVGFEATPMPARASDVEQLGRIEHLRELRTAVRASSLGDVLNAAAAGRHEIADYAANWAAVTLFAQHPAYAAAFGELERGPLAPDFNDRLARMPGYAADRASRDFDAFTDDIDYGYDFARSAIDWSAGRSIRGGERFEVAAARGWQNSGISISEGQSVGIEATGRCTLGAVGEMVIESEPDGISLDWYRGRPLGQLLVALWVDAPADGGRPRFMVVGEGRRSRIGAAGAGPVYFKINEPPGDLGDNRGGYAVEFGP